MDLERHLPPAVDDPEPTWADEDAARRVKEQWLARAREMAAKVEARLAAERSGETAGGLAIPAVVRDEDRDEDVTTSPAETELTPLERFESGASLETEDEVAHADVEPVTFAVPAVELPELTPEWPLEPALAIGDEPSEVAAAPLDDSEPPAVHVPPPQVPARVSPQVLPRAPIRRPSWPFTRVAAVAVAAVGVTAVVVTMLVPRAPVTTVSKPAQVAVKPVPTRAASSVASRPVPVSAWHETTEWTAGRKRSVAYEVSADKPVRLWMRQVTPVLVVRCLAGTLDAFVVTQSPSALEAGRSDHTVRLAFDDHPEAVERWTDSAEHDGLFAPDGAAMLARAAGATTLRFTFTPHNAPPAEASFNLAGAGALEASLTKYCR